MSHGKSYQKLSEKGRSLSELVNRAFASSESWKFAAKAYTRAFLQQPRYEEFLTKESYRFLCKIAKNVKLPVETVILIAMVAISVALDGELEVSFGDNPNRKFNGTLNIFMIGWSGTGKSKAIQLFLDDPINFLNSLGFQKYYLDTFTEKAVKEVFKESLGVLTIKWDEAGNMIRSLRRTKFDQYMKQRSMVNCFFSGNYISTVFTNDVYLQKVNKRAKVNIVATSQPQPFMQIIPFEMQSLDGYGNNSSRLFSFKVDAEGVQSFEELEKSSDKAKESYWTSNVKMHRKEMDMEESMPAEWEESVRNPRIAMLTGKVLGPLALLDTMLHKAITKTGTLFNASTLLPDEIGAKLVNGAASIVQTMHQQYKELKDCTMILADQTKTEEEKLKSMTYRKVGIDVKLELCAIAGTCVSASVFSRAHGLQRDFVLKEMRQMTKEMGHRYFFGMLVEVSPGVFIFYRAPDAKVRDEFFGKLNFPRSAYRATYSNDMEEPSLNGKGWADIENWKETYKSWIQHTPVWEESHAYESFRNQLIENNGRYVSKYVNILPMPLDIESVEEGRRKEIREDLREPRATIKEQVENLATDRDIFNMLSRDEFAMNSLLNRIEFVQKCNMSDEQRRGVSDIDKERIEVELQQNISANEKLASKFHALKKEMQSEIVRISELFEGGAHESEYVQEQACMQITQPAKVTAVSSRNQDGPSTSHVLEETLTTPLSLVRKKNEVVERRKGMKKRLYKEQEGRLGSPPSPEGNKYLRKPTIISSSQPPKS